MGKCTDDANRWQRRGERPIPGRETLLIATKAVQVLSTHFVKWEVVQGEGINQYPSHLSSVIV